MENNNTKKKINIVDILIIVLLVICIVGLALRFVLIKNTPDPNTLPDVETEKYYVSFITRDLRYSITDYLKDGTELRFSDTNKPFGTVYGSLDVKNAQKRYFTSSGEYVSVYNMAEDERVARYDIQGTVLVEGKLNDDGILVINDSASYNVALNKDVMLRSDNLLIKVYVTKITPVAG